MISALQLSVFPLPAYPADFLKLAVERRIEKALPGSDVSIAGISASHGKGILIEDLSISAGGHLFLKAEAVSVGYGLIGSFVSSMFSKILSQSAEIEIERMEVFFPADTQELLRQLLASRSKRQGFRGEGGSMGWVQWQPKIKIRDSFLNFQGEKVAVHESDFFLAHGGDGDKMEIVLEKGHISLPDRGMSVKNLTLTSKVLTADGLKVGSVSGNGAFENSRGNIQAKFGILIPKDNTGVLWEGWAYLSDFSLLNRNGKASFSSVTLGRDGVLSVQGDLSLGSLSSHIKTKIKTAGGGLVPKLNEKDKFEIEGDLFRRYHGGNTEMLPLGGLKVSGDIKKENGALTIRGKLSEDHQLDLFDVGRQLEEFKFNFFLKNYKIDSGNLLIKSPTFLMKSEFQTSGGSNSEIKYKFESKDIFHLSKATRVLRGYGISGAVRSFGKLTRDSDGSLFLSGEATAEKISATFQKRIRIDEGKIDFKVPLEGAPLENTFVRASVKKISYGEAFAKEISFATVDRDMRINFVFEDDRSFDLIAKLHHDNGKLYTEVKKAELKANDSTMSLSQNFLISAHGRKIELENVALRGKKSYLHLTGSYEWGKEPSRISLFTHFSGLNTQFFEVFYPSLAKHRGLLSGRIVVDGPTSWPVANVDLKYGSASNRTKASLSVVREVFSDRFSASLEIDEESGGSLKVTSGISSTDKENPQIKSALKDISNYDFKLKATNFNMKPLGFLSGKIKNLDGAFSGSLSLVSGGETPDIKGKIDVRNAEVMIDPWTETMEVEFAQMVFNKGGILFSFRTRDSFGEAEAEGNFNISNFSYSCKTTLEGIYMRIKHLHSGFYGTIFIEGQGKNIKVRGRDLKTKNASIWIKPNHNTTVGGLVFIDSLDSGDEGFLKEKKPGFFALTSDLDLNLRVSEDTKFRLDKVNSLLKGRLLILRKPGDNFSSVQGDLSLFKGSYSVFGKRFVIDKGSVSVSSRAHLSPIVDINAFYETSDLWVKANLHGEASNLKLQLSSIPVMKEDEIVLALLATKRKGNGRALGVVKKTLQDTRTVGYTAFGYAADGLVSSVLESSNLFTFVDVFSIAKEGRGSILDSEIEVGAYVTDRLYFSYERINETLPVSASYKSKLTMEYDLSKHFVLEAITGGLTPGLNLLFNVDFR